MSIVRASVIQAATASGVNASVAKVREFASTARQEGSKLAVFPEAFLAGYPRGSSFGALVGSRSASGREEFRKYWESAIDVPGPVVSELGTIAAEFAIAIVIGVVERDAGTLYCTVLFFDSHGQYRGKHRKLMPTGSERLIWGFGDGSTLTVVDTEIGRIGAVVCWENYMPLLRSAMYAKGVQIYCAPTADARDTWTATMRHVACEGRCFVLGANQFTPATSSTDGEPAGDDSGSPQAGCRGGSLIVSPLGEVLAGPCYGREAILTADLDLDDIVRGKYDFDVVGHYSRPDVFQLTVDERVQQSVVSLRTGPVG